MQRRLTSKGLTLAKPATMMTTPATGDMARTVFSADLHHYGEGGSVTAQCMSQVWSNRNQTRKGCNTGTCK